MITEVAHHFRIALRIIRRRPAFAAINIFGLAIGVAACLLIFHYVQDERAFDRFHEKGDRIYRLVTEGEFPAVEWPYGRILEDEYPEVEEVLYIRTWPTFPIIHEGERFYQDLFYAETSFFDLFDFPLIEGDGATALAEPFSLVISEELAQQLFGSRQAVGQSVRYGEGIDLTVTAVASVPRQSHIQFTGIVSMATLRDILGPESFDQQMEAGWGNVNMMNYVLLRPGADSDAFAARIRDLPHERNGERLREAGMTMHLGLEPLHDIYLRSPLASVLGPSGDIDRVRLLTVVALLILLLASVNFVNLSTARSTERAKEVGVRKALGSDRPALVRQFLVESFMTSLISVLLGLGIARIGLPAFSALANRSYTWGDLTSVSSAVALLVLVTFIGLLAGLYPAMSLTRFQPVDVLRGRFSSGQDGARIRQGLVVLQFGVASVLVVGTIVVLQQLMYMQGRDPGFETDQVLVVDAERAPRQTRAVLKETLQSHSGVQRASAAYAMPGRAGWPGQLAFPASRPDGEGIALEFISVDHAYVGTLGLEIVAGRDFNPEIATDAELGVIINESAVRAAGWATPETAVGQAFPSPGSGKPEGVVIGVVKDHHHHGLQEQIQPIMYGINEWAHNLLVLRIDAGRAAEVIAFLETTWDDLLAGYPYGYTFLDEAFAQQYAEERRLARIFATFTILAVLIGCLGLLGLAAYVAQQRTKEVGVRKVLGATAPQLVALLSKDFLKLVGIAVVVGMPVAYWAMSRWLEGFAYRIDLGIEIFVASALLTALVALVTVAGQALRAAMTEPVKAIRTE